MTLHSAAYKVYIPTQRKVIKSGHVVFHERNQQDWGSQIQAERDQDWDLGLDTNVTQPSQSPVNIDAASTTPDVEHVPDAVAIQQLIDEGRDASLTAPPPTMATRGIKRDYRALHHGTHRAGGERAYSVRDTILHALKSGNASLKEPTTYSEALSSEQHEEWQEAINAELLSIQQNEVWHEVAQPPPDIKPLTTKWVFKIKTWPHIQGQIYRKVQR